MGLLREAVHRGRRGSHGASRRIVAVIVACALMCVCTLAACSHTEDPASSRPAAKVLRVASTYTHAPYESMSESEPQGFAVELLKLMANDMGVEIEFLPASKSEIGACDKVTAGDADMLLESAYDENTQNGDVVLTASYIHANSGMMMLKGTDLSQFTDETGMRVGVWEESPFYGWAQRNMPNSTIVGYSSVDEALADLEAKNLDGVICDEPDARYRVKTGYADVYVADTKEQSYAYSFAVALGNDDLCNRLSDALAHVKESGAYDKLYDSWFGE